MGIFKAIPEVPTLTSKSFPIKNLLFISYYFPPTKTIASVRNFNICFEFLKHYNVWVFTTRNQKRFAKDDYPHLAVQERSWLWTLDFRTLIPNRAVRKKAVYHARPNLIYRLLWSFPANLLIGVGGIAYIIHGVMLGSRKIKQHNITHLYSSFFPYSDHFICYLLKWRFPNLVWIADFRDLQFSPGQDDVIMPGFQRWCNKVILRKASIVTTVSKGLAEHLKPFNERTLVVRNGIGGLLQQITPDLPSEKGGQFIMNYTGGLIPGKSSPDRLFEALKSLMDDGKINASTFQIRYAGNNRALWDEKVKEYGIKDLNFSADMVPLKTSLGLQQTANVNLLLSYSSEGGKGILTGKLYEYIHAARPILLIINGPRDEEFEEIFEALGSGLIVYNDEEGALSKIKSFLMEKMESPSVASDTKNDHHPLMIEHTMEYQCRKLFEALESF